MSRCGWANFLLAAAGRYIAGAVMFSVVWFVLAIMVLTFGCSCSTYMACVCLCCRRRPLPQKTDDEDEYGRRCTDSALLYVACAGRWSADLTGLAVDRSPHEGPETDGQLLLQQGLPAGHAGSRGAADGLLLCVPLAWGEEWQFGVCAGHAEIDWRAPPIC